MFLEPCLVMQTIHRFFQKYIYLTSDKTIEKNDVSFKIIDVFCDLCCIPKPVWTQVVHSYPAKYVTRGMFENDNS